MHCRYGEGDTVIGAEPFGEFCDVVLHRGRAQIDVVADLLVGHAAADEAKNVGFGISERLLEFGSGKSAAEAGRKYGQPDVGGPDRVCNRTD